jgi:energy-coupling factor transport system permease protein
MIFVYRPGDSFLHRADSVSKLVWLATAGAFVLVAGQWQVSAAVFAAVLLTGIVLGRLRASELLRRMIPLWIIAVWLLCLFSVLYPEGTNPVLRIGPLSVTGEGISYGLAIAFRVLTLGSSALIFAATTDPRRLVNELILVLKLPYRFAYAFYSALRFLPLLQTEARTILDARAIRGQGYPAKGVAERLALLRGLTVSLLAGAIRRVQITAVAMDSRGFGAYPTRTEIEDVHRPAGGIVFAAVWVVALVAYVIVFVVFGDHSFLKTPVGT